MTYESKLEKSPLGVVPGTVSSNVAWGAANITAASAAAADATTLVFPIVWKSSASYPRNSIEI